MTMGLKCFKNTKIVVAIAHFKIFMGTGQGWIGWCKYPVLLAIALKVYLPEASLLTMIIITLAIILIMTFIGWFDLKYIRLSQTTSEISTRKYNPFFRKLEETINRKI